MGDPLIIVVTGSRYLSSPDIVRATLSEYLDRKVILFHGNNLKGVDTFADDFAVEVGWDCRRCTAKWLVYGLAAGPIRNGEMLRDAKWYAEHKGWEIICLAFPGPKSTGTIDCMEQAESLKIFVRETKVAA